MGGAFLRWRSRQRAPWESPKRNPAKREGAEFERQGAAAEGVDDWMYNHAIVHRWLTYACSVRRKPPLHETRLIYSKAGWGFIRFS
jgi:hypothetical protein